MILQSRRQLTLLFVTLFLVTVGFGIIFPIMPFFAKNLGATPTDIGIIFGLFALMQFLASPFWGQLSDQFGRRPIFLIGLVGFGISFLMFGMAQSLGVIYLARILGGLLSAAVVPAAMAYVADSTDPAHRAKWMGLMGAAMSLGFIFGPALGGIAGEVNLSLPFFIGAGFTFLVAIFAFLFLPESQRAISNTTPMGSQVNRESFTKLFTLLRSRSRSVLIVGFLSSISMTILFATIALYAEAKFGFDQSNVGVFFVVFAGFGALGQGLLVNPLINKFGEGRVIHGGLIISGLGFLLILLSFDLHSWLLFSVPLSIGSAVVGPAMTSWISKRNPPTDQGIVMGVFNSYQSLGRVVGPLLGGALFDISGADLPLVLAAMVLIASFVVWRRLENRNPTPSMQ